MAVTQYGRGSTKTLHFSHYLGGPLVQTAAIGAGQDINVSSVTVTTQGGPGESIRTFCRVVYGPITSEEYPIQLNTIGTQTIHMTYDPPIQIRQGDHIIVGDIDAQTASGVLLTLLLNGTDATPPPAVMASDSIKVE